MNCNEYVFDLSGRVTRSAVTAQCVKCHSQLHNEVTARAPVPALPALYAIAESAVTCQCYSSVFHIICGPFTAASSQPRMTPWKPTMRRRNPKDASPCTTAVSEVLHHTVKDGTAAQVSELILRRAERTGHLDRHRGISMNDTTMASQRVG